MNALRYHLRPCVSVVKIESEDSIRRLLRKTGRVFHNKHKDKQLTPVSIEDQIEYVMNNLTIVLIEDQYLLMVDTYSPWFATDRILSEEMVLRYADGTATFHDVVKVVEDLKHRLNCDFIQVGTLACKTKRQHEALTRLYERQGFTVQQVGLWR